MTWRATDEEEARLIIAGQMKFCARWLPKNKNKESFLSLSFTSFCCGHSHYPLLLFFLFAQSEKERKARKKCLHKIAPINKIISKLLCSELTMVTRISLTSLTHSLVCWRWLAARSSHWFHSRIELGKRWRSIAIIIIIDGCDEKGKRDAMRFDERKNKKEMCQI